MELERDHYDVLVIGTGLAESIAAASLANSGKSVLHLDPNEYYGASQASLTLDELASWADARSGPSPPSGSSHTQTYATNQRILHSHARTTPLSPRLGASRRAYALSLYPALLPARGALIQTLIDSGVSKYVGFRLLDGVSVWDRDADTANSVSVGAAERDAKPQARRVPGSKEDVFRDKSVSLVDKRRLMRFLMFVAGDFEGDELLRGKEDLDILSFLQTTFSLPPPLAAQVLYAIAHCSSPSEPTLPALLRTRRYLKSIGRYGPSAFLLGQFGGAGEIAQGFCRACAVKGGTYILGPQAVPTSLELDIDVDGERAVRVELPCHPRPITASYLVTTPDHLPSENSQASNASDVKASRADTDARRTAHAIAILPELPEALVRPAAAPTDADAETVGQDKDDTALVVFAPEETGGKLVRALLMGEGTGSCPAGQYVLYLSTDLDADAGANTDFDPEAALRPFLRKLHPEPSFEAYYLAIAHELQNVGAERAGHVHVLRPYSGAGRLTEGLDWEAEQGRRAWEWVMGVKADGSVVASGEAGEGEEGKTETKGWWEDMGEDEEPEQ